MAIGRSLINVAHTHPQSATMFLIQALTTRKSSTAFTEGIDSVFGPSIPQEINTSQLPYLNACVTEVLRWRQAAKLGFTRDADQYDSLDEYHVPRGSMIQVNAWAMHDIVED
ncbi:hypothetical protein B0T14DRAFT_601467 [Immersiella caudata]|uniref:Cytochrome P450 n=1 Tax=Immersiella caudata TaxID=314043 RepID=A0AA40C2N8_9PEZI|nr:hypothetical protein B0T14DRAFT_601467 [Immersiella caudata]